jgi:hypothetical protein
MKSHRSRPSESSCSRTLLSFCLFGDGELGVNIHVHFGKCFMPCDEILAKKKKFPPKSSGEICSSSKCRGTILR